MRCPRCGSEADRYTGRCSRCGFVCGGTYEHQEKETFGSKLQLAFIHTRNRLRVFWNRVATFEHKGIAAVLILAVIVIILLTVITSRTRG